MSAPPQPVCTGLLNTPCCGIDACSATLRCDPATKKCVVAGECTPHVTRPCTGVTGCAGGFESCDPNGKWSGVCLGGPGKTCPAGWTSDIGSATCTRKKHVTFVMKDDKPDGYNYGRISVGFETYGGTVETTVAFSYGDGGCFSSSTKDAVLLFGEKFQPEELGQCETGAPSKCKAGTSRSGLGSWVEMHKIKGWTPLLQGTCQKVADIDFKASVAMRCSW